MQWTLRNAFLLTAAVVVSANIDISSANHDWYLNHSCSRVAASFAENLHPIGHTLTTWKSPVFGHVPGQILEVDHHNVYDTVYAPGMDVFLFLGSVEMQHEKLARGLIGAPNVVVAVMSTQDDQPEDHRYSGSTFHHSAWLCKHAWWKELTNSSRVSAFLFPSKTKRQYRGTHGKDSIVAVEKLDAMGYEKVLHEQGQAYHRTKASAIFFGITVATKSEPKITTSGYRAAAKVVPEKHSNVDEYDQGEPYQPNIVNAVKPEMQKRITTSVAYVLSHNSASDEESTEWNAAVPVFVILLVVVVIGGLIKIWFATQKKRVSGRAPLLPTKGQQHRSACPQNLLNP